MIKEGKIGVQEAVCLTTITISNKILFGAPNALTRVVGNAGWYTALIADLVTILAFSFIYLLLKRFPGKDIIEIFSLSMGPILGFIFSFTFSAAFVVGASILLREFIDVLNTFVFPATPPSVLLGAFVIVIAVAVFLGFETIARVSKLFAYVALFAFILLFAFASRDFRFSNLFPILGYGLGKSVMLGFERSSAFSEVIVIAVFAGSLQGIQHVKKIGFISLILSGCIISGGIFCITLVFPYYMSQEITAPIYVMARLIKHGNFLQRTDPLFLFLWSITTFISIAVLIYAAISSYCKTFRMQDTKPVILPMMILLYTTAMIPRDFTSLIEQYVELLRVYAIFIFYILPFIALITAALRKKRMATGDG